MIDGSTKEAFDRSMLEMTSALSPEDRRIFGDGAMHLILERYPLTAGLTGLERLTVLPMAVEAAHIILDGVSFDKIMEAGRAQQKSRTVANPNPETSPAVNPTVAETEARMECANERIAIASPRVSRERNLVFDVTNNLGWPIGTLVVDYTLSTEGRSVPWDTGTQAVSISGGIEPGETREIAMTAGRSLWGITEDLDLAITTRDAWDPERRPLVGQRRYHGMSEERAVMPCE